MTSPERRSVLCRPLKPPPSRRRQVFAWAMFDFANSSFTTVIVTVVYAVYFAKVIAPDGGAALWSLCGTISNIVIIATAPIVGAIADHSSSKKKFLFVSYLVCVLCTAALSLAGPGAVVLAMTLFILANIGYASGENLVAGFLPDLAKPEEMGRVSATGWALGYAGGLASLLIALEMVKVGEDAWTRATTILVAVFFCLGGIPTFLWVRERRRPDAPPTSNLLTAGFAQVRDTWRQRRQHPELFRFFFAYLVFNIGIYGVISFSGIYAEQLFGMELEDVVKLFIASQVTAALGALGSGIVAQRIGCVKTLALTLLVWIAAGVVALAAQSASTFWIVALLAGGAIGASLSVARATVGKLAPEAQSAEMFGFWGLFARLAALLAASGNFVILMLTGDNLRAGIVYFTATFIVGLLMLWSVDEAKGQARAAAASEG